MMKMYADPIVQVLAISEQDVLTTSYEPGDDDNGKDDIFAD